MARRLKILFAGTPKFAATTLSGLLDSQHQVLAVWTQPDRPQGRGRKLLPSPVKALALEHALPVHQPTTLKDEQAQKTWMRYQADLCVVVAYGLLLPQSILDATTYGCINVHASLLPQFRGASPIAAAILAGEHSTGVSIMQMEAGLDTGPVLAQVSVAIGARDTTLSLNESLAVLGRDTLLAVLAELDDVKPQIQDDALASYAPKIHKKDAAIDWSNSARAIERMIRAYVPQPVAYSYLEEDYWRFWQAQALDEAAESSFVPGCIVDVSDKGLDIATGQGVLRVTHMQLPGKSSRAVAELMHGYDLMKFKGQMLG